MGVVINLTQRRKHKAVKEITERLLTIPLIDENVPILKKILKEYQIAIDEEKQER